MEFIDSWNQEIHKEGKLEMPFNLGIHNAVTAPATVLGRAFSWCSACVSFAYWLALLTMVKWPEQSRPHSYSPCRPSVPHLRKSPERHSDWTNLGHRNESCTQGMELCDWPN